jgi:hypothetical protein
MILHINYSALDVPGLWETAYRLHRIKQGTSPDKIFGRLLDGRIEYLQKNCMLIKGRSAA